MRFYLFYQRFIKGSFFESMQSIWMVGIAPLLYLGIPVYCRCRRGGSMQFRFYRRVNKRPLPFGAEYQVNIVFTKDRPIAFIIYPPFRFCGCFLRWAVPIVHILHPSGGLSYCLKGRYPSLMKKEHWETIPCINPFSYVFLIAILSAVEINSSMAKDTICNLLLFFWSFGRSKDEASTSSFRRFVCLTHPRMKESIHSI